MLRKEERPAVPTVLFFWLFWLDAVFSSHTHTDGTHDIVCGRLLPTVNNDRLDIHQDCFFLYSHRGGSASSSESKGRKRLYLTDDYVRMVDGSWYHTKLKTSCLLLSFYRGLGARCHQALLSQCSCWFKYSIKVCPEREERQAFNREALEKKRKVGNMVMRELLLLLLLLLGRGCVYECAYLWSSWVYTERLNNFLHENNLATVDRRCRFSLRVKRMNESDLDFHRFHSTFSLFNRQFLFIFNSQNFQEANAYCYWNGSLLEAVTSLTFVGHVTPSTILVTGDESCLETVRSAWARKVLRAPSAYTIALVGNVHETTLYLNSCLIDETRHARDTFFLVFRDCFKRQLTTSNRQIPPAALSLSLSNINNI